MTTEKMKKLFEQRNGTNLLVRGESGFVECQRHLMQQEAALRKCLSRVVLAVWCAIEKVQMMKV